MQLQNWNEKVRHFAHQAGRVGADGMLQWTVGGLGAQLAHIHQDVHLDGRGASAEVNGVTFATDRQLLSYYTQQTHHAPTRAATCSTRTCSATESRVVWRGMIKVDKDAQKTDGYQRNDALLLSATPASTRSPAWRSRPTTSAARTGRRPAASTKSRCSTACAAA